jgi:hypothetical protein
MIEVQNIVVRIFMDPRRTLSQLNPELLKDEHIRAAVASQASGQKDLGIRQAYLQLYNSSLTSV